MQIFEKLVELSYKVENERFSPPLFAAFGIGMTALSTGLYIYLGHIPQVIGMDVVLCIPTYIVTSTILLCTTNGIKIIDRIITRYHEKCYEREISYKRLEATSLYLETRNDVFSETVVNISDENTALLNYSDKKTLILEIENDNYLNKILHDNRFLDNNKAKGEQIFQQFSNMSKQDYIINR